MRVGYDNVAGFLAGGIRAWETGGREYGTLGVIHAADLQKRIDAGEEFTLLDVRSRDEFERGRLRNAIHIYVGELPQRMEELRKDRPVTTLCGSGQRAMIAASYLRRQGVREVEDCLGSMAACKSLGCEVIGAK